MAIIKTKKAGGVITKKEPAGASGTAAVFVRGFDFGTSQKQLKDHCSTVGTVKTVAMQKGSAVVTFSSFDEAQTAVEALNKSTIDGNSRFIDVSIDKKSLPPKPGMTGVKRTASQALTGQPEDSCRVFVRGFDFDTSDEQLEGHMGSVGAIEQVKWVTKGSAEVVYSSPEEAAAAVEQLQGTTIDGNTRFIDVKPREAVERAAPAKRFNSGGKGGGQWVDTSNMKQIAALLGGGKGFGGKGGGQWVDTSNMKQIAALLGIANVGGGKGFGGKKGASKGGFKKRGGDHKDEDPAGSGRVFVRGFDFGTDDDMFEGHMKAAGPIHTVHWCTKGSAVVVYKRKASAVKAASQLQGTTIDGNARFIDVILKD